MPYNALTVERFQFTSSQLWNWGTACWMTQTMPNSILLLVTTMMKPNIWCCIAISWNPAMYNTHYTLATEIRMTLILFIQPWEWQSAWLKLQQTKTTLRIIMIKKTVYCFSTAISCSQTMCDQHNTMTLVIARSLILFSNLWEWSETCLMAIAMPLPQYLKLLWWKQVMDGAQPILVAK